MLHAIGLTVLPVMPCVCSDGDTMVDMAAGDLFIVRYAPVAHLVARRDAVLV